MEELVSKIACVGFWMNSKIQFPLLLGILKHQEDKSVKKETYKPTRWRYMRILDIAQKHKVGLSVFGKSSIRILAAPQKILQTCKPAVYFLQF